MNDIQTAVILDCQQRYERIAECYQLMTTARDIYQRARVQVEQLGAMWPFDEDVLIERMNELNQAAAEQTAAQAAVLESAVEAATLILEADALVSALTPPEQAEVGPMCNALLMRYGLYQKVNRWHN